jgi:ADP-ribose pyrophosphatase
VEIGSRTFTVRGRSVTHQFDRETLELPAGRAEAGESPEETARRELEEETGHQAGSLTYLFTFYPTPGYSDEEVHVFAAEALVETATRFDPSEEIQLLRLTAEEADAALRSGRIRDGKTMLTLLAMRADLRCPPPWRGPAAEPPPAG